MTSLVGSHPALADKIGGIERRLRVPAAPVNLVQLCQLPGL